MDEIKSLTERLNVIGNQEKIKIACVGGVYLDFELHGIEPDKSGKYYLDFTQETPVQCVYRPGGSVYHVSRHLLELQQNPLLVSCIGSNERGFANTFFRLAEDALSYDTCLGIKKIPGNFKTATTFHFICSQPQRTGSAMYTDWAVLGMLNWELAFSPVQSHVKNGGVVYIAGFFKTKLYDKFSNHLYRLQNDYNSIIFLDHGRFSTTIEREKISSLLAAFSFIDVYFTTKEELFQLMQKIFERPINFNESCEELVEQAIKNTGQIFPTIMIIFIKHQNKPVRLVGVRNNNAYSWREVSVNSVHTLKHRIVGGGNTFHAAFISEFIKLKHSVNATNITNCVKKAQCCVEKAQTGLALDFAYRSCGKLTENENDTNVVSLEPASVTNAELLKIIDDRFDFSEIKSLCFDINIDTDNLNGTIKREKIISLIQYLRRRQKISILTEWINKNRVDIVIQ